MQHLRAHALVMPRACLHHTRWVHCRRLRDKPTRHAARDATHHNNKGYMMRTARQCPAGYAVEAYGVHMQDQYGTHKVQQVALYYPMPS